VQQRYLFKTPRQMPQYKHMLTI